MANIGETIEEINEIYLSGKEDERHNKLVSLREELKNGVRDILLFRDIDWVISLTFKIIMGIIIDRGEIHAMTLKDIGSVYSDVFADRTILKVTEFINNLKRIADYEGALIG